MHTRLGSKSCWLGTGTFWLQQLEQNTFPQFLEMRKNKSRVSVSSRDRLGNQLPKTGLPGMQLRYAGDGDSSTPNSPVGLTQEEARQGREPSRAQSHTTFTLGSRTLGCLITTAQGYQLSEGTAQQRSMKANGPRAEGSPSGLPGDPLSFLGVSTQASPNVCLTPPLKWNQQFPSGGAVERARGGAGRPPSRLRTEQAGAGRTSPEKVPSGGVPGRQGAGSSGE